MQELVAANWNNLACWREGRSEVEFICEVDGTV